MEMRPKLQVGAEHARVECVMSDGANEKAEMESFEPDMGEILHIMKGKRERGVACQIFWRF